MDIPPDVQIRSTIQYGSVYYFPEESLKSLEPHYFIVLNIDPISDIVICLVCVQSDIENVRNVIRKGCPNETLVEITPEQYPKLKWKSIIDCSYVLPTSIDNIVKKLSNGELQRMPEMDLDLVDKLRKGAILSDVVVPEIKKVLGFH